MTPLSIAVVVNPHSRAGRVAGLWERARAALRREGAVCGEIETRGDGDIDRIAELVRRLRPAVLVAVGGDGTVSDAAHGIMAAGAPAPALAIVPFGTGNDIGRGLGLLACQAGSAGQAGFDLAIRTVLTGSERRIDLGRVGSRYFVGTFGIGMDAEILRTRNRVRRKLGLHGIAGGYPLYLWSCAVNLLRCRALRADLRVDGSARVMPVYNLVVTNTPQYAGEFRFDGDNTADDGRLDLHVFTGPLDYLRRLPQAWRRHVRYTAGQRVQPAREIERVGEVRIELPSPVATQSDGEERVPSAVYEIRVVPRALTVRVPAPRQSVTDRR